MKSSNNVEKYYSWSNDVLLNDRVYNDDKGMYSRSQLNDLAVDVQTISEATKRMANILHNGDNYNLNIAENFEEEEEEYEM